MQWFPWKKSVFATLVRYSSMQITRAAFPLIPFRYPRAAPFKDQWHGYWSPYIRIIIQEETERDTSRVVGTHIGAVADGHKSHSPGAKTTKGIPGLLRSPTIRVLQNVTPPAVQNANSRPLHRSCRCTCWCNQ